MIDKEIFSLPLDKADFCVIDFETTGLNPRYNNVIDVGIVRVSGFQIKETFQSLINPGRDIPYFITQFTGITNEDVYDAPFFDEVIDEIEEFISDKVLCGHNLPFDYSFLKKEFTVCGHDAPLNPNVCTLKIARRLFPTLRSKSLSSVCNHLKIKNLDAHRALSDAKVTAQILIKMIKELEENFEIKNIGQLIAFQKTSLNPDRHVKIKKKLQEDIILLPDAPGIYSFLNSKGDIIYIGKAKSLQKRIKSYFSPAAPRKAKKIVKQASRLKVALTNSELTALLMEAEAIKLIDPKHNTMLKRYGSKYFLRINTTKKFPSIDITNVFDFDGNDYFGLFINKKKALKVEELIHKTFAIRECTETELKKGRTCFLADIERCTAPCVNKDNSLYNSELEKVYEFLYGKSQNALNRLLNKMKKYSEKEKYEKAAEVKELIDFILSQTHKTSLLAEPVNSANALFEIDGGFTKDYVLMLTGKIYIKKYPLDGKDLFDIALEDYFTRTIQTNILPNEEDLEKIKITLNWLIKNRNKVRVFYLKEFQNKEDLFYKMGNFGSQSFTTSESTFDIKNFIHNDQEISTT